MDIVIIEDERVVAEDLERNIIALIDRPVRIIQLRSVKESVAYFKSEPQPDIIFSDIQLGDGLSFEIFIAAQLTAPIIFCTAYDEYALEAFKVNGIDYILKPFTRQTLEAALKKYSQLKDIFAVTAPQQYNNLMQLLVNRDQAKAASILVYYQDRIKPIKLHEIALFQLENDVVQLHTFSGKVYYPNKNLDELERLTGNHFFRANRQFLVCRKAIIDVSSFFSRKLSLNLSIVLTERITVSKGRTAAFLEWLANAE
ncbi:LytR/AlgR family response regulator transcription factor [Pedobacter metabolipauper]|uniref:LytTR family two component transcriptional regulator n=1 Tax=Pedobacter metabolipauper TaxID=425513 RepID=A0A4R6SYU3_9SPHI|nr:LytTR family DNA-binding domain-containing protein [Pedobacter metabolipauper]TDQ11185.1 LytTR family two component transcriptional regulator [Pedobacter metabolipauper]